MQFGFKDIGNVIKKNIAKSMVCMLVYFFVIFVCLIHHANIYGYPIRSVQEIDDASAVNYAVIVPRIDLYIDISHNTRYLTGVQDYIKVSIYQEDAEGERDVVWEEILFGVRFFDGRTNLRLGNNNPIAYPLEKGNLFLSISFSDDGAVFLDEESLPLLDFPFALYADYAHYGRNVYWRDVINKPLLGSLEGVLADSQLPHNIVDASKIHLLDARKVTGRIVPEVYPIATQEAFGLVKIGNGLQIVGSELLMNINTDYLESVGLATRDRVLSAQEVVDIASRNRFYTAQNLQRANSSTAGVVQLSSDFSLNSDQQIEVNVFTLRVDENAFSDDTKISFSKLNIQREHITALGFPERDTVLENNDIQQHLLTERYLSSIEPATVDRAGTIKFGNDFQIENGHISVRSNMIQVVDETILAPDSKIDFEKLNIRKRDLIEIGVVGVDSVLQRSDIEEILVDNGFLMQALPSAGENRLGFATIGSGFQIFSGAISISEASVPFISNDSIADGANLPFLILDIQRADIIGLGIAGEDSVLMESEVEAFITQNGYLKLDTLSLATHTTSGFLNLSSDFSITEDGTVSVEGAVFSNLGNDNIANEAAISFSKLDINIDDLVSLGIPTVDTNRSIEDVESVLLALGFYNADRAPYLVSFGPTVTTVMTSIGNAMTYDIVDVWNTADNSEAVYALQKSALLDFLFSSSFFSTQSIEVPGITALGVGLYRDSLGMHSIDTRLISALENLTIVLPQNQALAVPEESQLPSLQLHAGYDNFGYIRISNNDFIEYSHAHGIAITSAFDRMIQDSIDTLLHRNEQRPILPSELLALTLEDFVGMLPVEDQRSIQNEHVSIEDTFLAYASYGFRKESVGAIAKRIAAEEQDKYLENMNVRAMVDAFEKASGIAVDNAIFEMPRYQTITGYGIAREEDTIDVHTPMKISDMTAETVAFDSHEVILGQNFDTMGRDKLVGYEFSLRSIKRSQSGVLEQRHGNVIQDIGLIIGGVAQSNNVQRHAKIVLPSGSFVFSNNYTKKNRNSKKSHLSLQKCFLSTKNPDRVMRIEPGSMMKVTATIKAAHTDTVDHVTFSISFAQGSTQPVISHEDIPFRIQKSKNNQYYLSLLPYETAFGTIYHRVANVDIAIFKNDAASDIF